MLVVSVVIAAVCAHGSTWDSTDLANKVMYLWLVECSLGLFFSRSNLENGLKILTHDLSCLRYYRKNRNKIQKRTYAINRNDTTLGFTLKAYLVFIIFILFWDDQWPWERPCLTDNKSSLLWGDFSIEVWTIFHIESHVYLKFGVLVSIH